MVALAALHMYRHILDTTFVFHRGSSENAANALALHGRFLAGRTSGEIYEAYLHYFDSAVKGQQVLMRETELGGVYLSASLISVISMVSLSTSPDEGRGSASEAANAPLWFRLGLGPRELLPLWRQRSGDDALREMGVFDGKPDFQNLDELFDRMHAATFEDLLTFGTEYETITNDESIAYQQALSYVGLIYFNLSGRLEEPLVTSRRYVAFPGRAPRAFCELVLQQRPRALAILAHAFAIIRLLEGEVPWYRGIAASQVLDIGRRLPATWQMSMRWPLAMLNVSPSDRTSLPDPRGINYRLLT